MAYPILEVNLPKTGWQVLAIQRGRRMWRHRCVACGDELFAEFDNERGGLQLVELCELYGLPPLCVDCQVQGALATE